eukprot:4255424-Prymnesium_polylepis.1
MTLDPTWNEEFVFEASLRTVQNCPMTFEVLDEDIMTSNDLLGTMELQLSAFISPHEQQQVEHQVVKPLMLNGEGYGHIEMRVLVELDPPNAWRVL